MSPVTRSMTSFGPYKQMSHGENTLGQQLSPYSEHTWTETALTELHGISPHSNLILPAQVDRRIFMFPTRKELESLFSEG